MNKYMTQKITFETISCMTKYTLILSVLQEYNFNNTEMLIVGYGQKFSVTEALWDVTHVEAST